MIHEINTITDIVELIRAESIHDYTVSVATKNQSQATFVSVGSIKSNTSGSECSFVLDLDVKGPAPLKCSSIVFLLNSSFLPDSKYQGKVYTSEELEIEHAAVLPVANKLILL